MENIKSGINWNKISRFLKIGIIGAIVIFAGDLLMGWGMKDMSMKGLEAQLSPHLAISDVRMIWVSVFGFAGVPIAVVGHYGIYKMLKPYSQKYVRFYAMGFLCFLAFGGSGVHISSIEAAYFYKYMTFVGSNAAVESTIKFVAYFLLPLYAIFLTGWVIMVYADIRAVLVGLSPLPRWGWIFSMPIGSLLFSLIGFVGNYEIVNAIMVGAFSLGNIWSIAGHLWMLRWVKENPERALAV